MELRRGQPRTPPKKQKTLDVPAPYKPREDDIDDAVRRDLDRMDLNTVGADGPRLFGVTPAEARRALARFIDHRLPAFGRYEDAIMGDDWAMAHSLLSVPLNLGVLHPLDAVEGFIRQILGWTNHIQRLTVLGSHALQRGYRPDELTD